MGARPWSLGQLLRSPEPNTIQAMGGPIAQLARAHA
jgi:hypothetical protein